MSPQTKSLTADSLSGTGLTAGGLVAETLPESTAQDGSILLEDGTSYLLMETGDQLLLE